MLWGKKKRGEAVGAGASGDRDRASDRALDSLAQTVRTYGKFGFDTDGRSANELAEACEQWAEKILRGDTRGGENDNGTLNERARLVRDYPGLSQFVVGQREAERDYVQRSLMRFRQAIVCFSGCLTNALGEDRRNDQRFETELSSMEQALEVNDAEAVFQHCLTVVTMAREAMESRRKREVEQVWQLGQSLKELRTQLTETRSQAEVDPLTQVLNRAAFDEAVANMASLGLLLGEPPWLVLADLDHFKSINDDYGHPAGDEVLRQVGHCLTRTFLRRDDVIARYGGEEFAVLLVDTQPEQMEMLAKRLGRAVRDLRVPVGDDEIELTISMGLAALRPGESVSDWVKRADVALYQAKHQGRDRHVVSLGERLPRPSRS